MNGNESSIFWPLLCWPTEYGNTFWQRTIVVQFSRPLLCECLSFGDQKTHLHCAVQTPLSLRMVTPSPDHPNLDAFRNWQQEQKFTHLDFESNDTLSLYEALYDDGTWYEIEAEVEAGLQKEFPLSPFFQLTFPLVHPTLSEHAATLQTQDIPVSFAHKVLHHIDLGVALSPTTVQLSDQDVFCCRSST